MRITQSGDIEGRMYMRIEGIKGDVVSPKVYMGQILCEKLTWPGTRIAQSSVTGHHGWGDIDGFPTFIGRQVGDPALPQFKVLCASGGHTYSLSRLLMTNDTNRRLVTIWIPRQPKPLMAVFGGALLGSLERRMSPDGVAMDYLTFNTQTARLGTYDGR